MSQLQIYLKNTYSCEIILRIALNVTRDVTKNVFGIYFYDLSTKIRWFILQSGQKSCIGTAPPLPLCGAIQFAQTFRPPQIGLS
jgi:hypothetical protein